MVLLELQVNLNFTGESIVFRGSCKEFVTSTRGALIGVLEVRRVLELTFIRILPELSYGCLKNNS